MNTTIILHSTLTPDAALAALRNSIDEERRTLFSVSGYKGDKPVLGEINGTEFRLQKRRYWRNDFAPHFYGRLLPEPGGTRIEGRFKLAEWVKIFMIFWIVVVAFFVASISVPALIGIATGGRHLSNDPDIWPELVLPPAMLVFGFFLPKFGRLMGRPEERFILEFLERALAAQRERPRAGDQSS